MNIAMLENLTDEELVRCADRSNFEVKLLAQRLEQLLVDYKRKIDDFENRINKLNEFHLHLKLNHSLLLKTYQADKQILNNIGQILADEKLKTCGRLEALQKYYETAVLQNKEIRRTD